MVFYLSTYFLNPVDVLEPSCGNGVFIEAFDQSIISVSHFDGVELDKSAINNIRPSHISSLKIFNEDFLYWENEKKYNLVIGNPPFIVRKRLYPNQASKCKEIHKEHSLLGHEVANVWTSFLLKSINFLKDDGVLAFVLPNEILQVKYAEEIRSYLARSFSRLELITFRQLTFDGIDQDTVVIFAYKAVSNKSSGVYIAGLDGVDNLRDGTPQFTHLPPLSLEQKWTTGILHEKDILLVESASSKILKVIDYCNSVAGIVTAATNFFIVNQEKVDEYFLEPYCKKIIQRGFLVNGCVDFTNKRFDELKTNNVPCFLIDTNNVNTFTEGLKAYLDQGKSLGIPTRYKCKLRKRWHDVPGIKKGQGFFFKRSHDYPKCIKNTADVYVTDSAYQIVMKERYTIENFIFSFYNSLTMLAVEMQGRYYGGGVLELTPNEFKKIPMPYTICENFELFSSKFDSKSNLDEILINNDKLILSQGLGLPAEEVEQIQLSYKKMKLRRLRSK